MFHCVVSDKSFYEAGVDLHAVILRHGYAVLRSDDLGEMLRSRGSDYDEECQVFEIFHPRPVEALLASDGRLAAVPPCRIAVYTDNGVTRLAALRPTQALPALLPALPLAPAVLELEERLQQMIDEAR